MKTVVLLLKYCRIILARKKSHSIIDRTACLNKKTILEGQNRIFDHSNINNAEIGLGTYVGRNCLLEACKIGRYCSIAWNVQVVSGGHPVSFASTYPGLYKPFSPVSFVNEKKTGFVDETTIDGSHKVIIGHDVWIGCNVLIKAGITIGDGAVIGMGSVVTKNVPPYAIVAGNPARVLRYRFSADVIQKLERTRWWELSYQNIKRLALYVDNIERFLNNLELDIPANEGCDPR